MGILKLAAIGIGVLIGGPIAMNMAGQVAGGVTNAASGLYTAAGDTGTALSSLLFSNTTSPGNTFEESSRETFQQDWAADLDAWMNRNTAGAYLIETDTSTTRINANGASQTSPLGQTRAVRKCLPAGTTMDIACYQRATVDDPWSTTTTPTPSPAADQVAALLTNDPWFDQQPLEQTVEREDIATTYRQVVLTTGGTSTILVRITDTAYIRTVSTHASGVTHTRTTTVSHTGNKKVSFPDLG